MLEDMFYFVSVKETCVILLVFTYININYK